MIKENDSELNILGFYDEPSNCWKEITYDEALQYQDEIKYLANNYSSLFPVSCGDGKIEKIDKDIKFSTSFGLECKNKIVAKISTNLLAKNKNLFQGELS